MEMLPFQNTASDTLKAVELSAPPIFPVGSELADMTQSSITGPDTPVSQHFYRRTNPTSCADSSTNFELVCFF